MIYRLFERIPPRQGIDIAMTCVQQPHAARGTTKTKTSERLTEPTNKTVIVCRHPPQPGDFGMALPLSWVGRGPPVNSVRNARIGLIENGPPYRHIAQSGRSFLTLCRSR